MDDNELRLENEGLEVVAYGYPDQLRELFKTCGSATCAVWNKQSGPLVAICLHSEALAGYAKRDARIAELEASPLMTPDECKAGFALQLAEINQLRAELAAIKSQEPVAWMLNNEKGRIEEILPYMPCASDMQPYWPEPLQLYAAPVAKQVVMPGRKDMTRGFDAQRTFAMGWNAYADEYNRLNAAGHIEHVRAMVVPDGWQLVPVDPTEDMQAAGQASGKNCAFSYAACYRAMLAAAPAQGDSK